jgi:hypothetical protein
MDIKGPLDGRKNENNKDSQKGQVTPKKNYFFLNKRLKMIIFDN